MNTPLEELTQKAWDEARKINVSKGRVSGVNASEALDWMAEQFLKESSRTEEIAIGFSKWLWSQGWSQIDGTDNDYFRFELKEKGKNDVIPITKTDSELFKDYMESLKP